jgi:hypothetical protein
MSEQGLIPAKSSGFDRVLVNLSLDERAALLAALAAMVIDVHCVQDNLTEAQWQAAERMFREVEESLNREGNGTG